MDKFIVKRIDNIDDFHNMGDLWNTLLVHDSSRTIFQLWEWNYCIWKNLEKNYSRLHILQFIDTSDESIVAIAPLCIKEKSYLFFKICTLEFIGDRFSDYRKFIIKDGYEKEIYNFFVQWIKQHPVNVDIVDLKNIIWTDESIRANIENCSNQEEFEIRITQYEIALYLNLNANKNVYENLTDPSFVKYLRRKVKKLQKDFNYQFITIDSNENLKKYIPDFIRLNKIRSNDKLQKGIFRSGDIEKMFFILAEQLLTKGMLRFHVLLLDDKVAACLLNFNFENKRLYYQSGLDTAFRKFSVGHVIHFFAIENALNEKNCEYDLLCGDEGYKTQWTTTHRDIYRMHIIFSRFKFSVLCAIEKFTQRMLNVNVLKRIYFLLKGN